MKKAPVRNLRTATDVDRLLAEAVTAEYADKVRVHKPAARRFLELNTNNRTPKKRKLEVLTRDFQDDELILSDSALMITAGPHHEMFNGQHRCMACEATGKPFETLLVLNADPRAKHHIDNNAPRSLGDTLKMEQFEDPFALASLAALHWKYKRNIGKAVNAVHRDIPANNLVMLEYVRETPELQDANREGQHINRVLRGYKRAAWGAAMALFREVDADDAQVFFSRLTTGVGLTTGDPIFALITRVGAATSVERSSQNLASIIHCWNAFRLGEKTQARASAFAVKMEDLVPMVK